MESKPRNGRYIKGSCSIKMINGVALLQMPDGTIVPHQTDITISSPAESFATATITVLVNLPDTVEIDRLRAMDVVSKGGGEETIYVKP